MKVRFMDVRETVWRIASTTNGQKTKVVSAAAYDDDVGNSNIYKKKYHFYPFQGLRNCIYFSLTIAIFPVQKHII